MKNRVLFTVFTISTMMGTLGAQGSSEIAPKGWQTIQEASSSETSGITMGAHRFSKKTIVLGDREAFINYIKKPTGNSITIGTPLASTLTDNEVKELIEANPRITELGLGGCAEITNQALTYLPKDLTKLDLSNCYKIYNLSAIRNFDKLNELSLAGLSKINGEDLWKVPSSVNTLNLSKTPNITYVPAARLRNLQNLDLTESSIKNEGLSMLPAGLLTLELSGTTISDLSGLKDISKLKTLKLINCKDLTSEGLATGLGFVSKDLEELNLAGTNFNGSPALKEFNKLRAINMTGCDLATNQAIENLPPSLKELFLGGSSGILNFHPLKSLNLEVLQFPNRTTLKGEELKKYLSEPS